MARGVLIGLTGCSAAQAFNALTQAAHHHDVPVFALAAVLTTTANETATPPDSTRTSPPR